MGKIQVAPQRRQRSSTKEQSCETPDILLKIKAIYVVLQPTKKTGWIYEAFYIPPRSKCQLEQPPNGDIQERMDKHVIHGLQLSRHINNIAILCSRLFASRNKCIASSNKCLTSSNKKLLGAPGLTSGNKKLLGTSATLLVTGALLVVTMFAIRNKRFREPLVDPVSLWFGQQRLQGCSELW